MRKSLVLSMVVLSAMVAVNAFAADNVAQTVTYQVSAINEISVSGNPGALIVITAVPGSQPTAVTDATTTYAITTNIANKKITGALNTAMPANTSLESDPRGPDGRNELRPDNPDGVRAGSRHGHQHARRKRPGHQLQFLRDPRRGSCGIRTEDPDAHSHRRRSVIQPAERAEGGASLRHPPPREFPDERSLRIIWSIRSSASTSGYEAGSNGAYLPSKSLRYSP